MSAPGSAPLGSLGPLAPRRGSTATPALPSMPRHVYSLRCVKWLGTAPRQRGSSEGQSPPLRPLQQEWINPCEAVTRIQSDASAVPGPPNARRAAAKNALVIAATTIGS
ncbi:MAG: hypothetical protein M1816_003268 [Peltula sp. TS41687]|nr:MAG: hypothetical protein M1816_003268 [Peltula sp. TS41687]